MNNLEKLEQDSSNNGIQIHNYYLGDSNLKGIYIDGHVALSTELQSSTEKTCVLIEELGHHYTSNGDILDLSSASNRKQELKARLWGYDKLIGLSGIVRAFENRCMNYYEVATSLEVTEEFFKEALDCYRSKYGVSVQYQNYVIYFLPCLCVVKMI